MSLQHVAKIFVSIEWHVQLTTRKIISPECNSERWKHENAKINEYQIYNVCIGNLIRQLNLIKDLIAEFACKICMSLHHVAKISLLM